MPETKEQRKEYNRKHYEKQKALKLVAKDFNKKEEETKMLIDKIKLLEDNKSILEELVKSKDEKIRYLEDNLKLLTPEKVVEPYVCYEPLSTKEDKNLKIKLEKKAIRTRQNESS